MSIARHFVLLYRGGYGTENMETPYSAHAQVFSSFHKLKTCPILPQKRLQNANVAFP